MTRYEPYQEANTELEMEDLLMNLPETYREVLLLRFCHDLSFREISSILGIAYEAVRSRYRRGIKCAAKKMQLHNQWSTEDQQMM